MSVERAKAKARAVLAKLNVKDFGAVERLWRAAALGIDDLADGLLADVDEDLGDEFCHLRHLMDGGENERQEGTRLRRALESLDIEVRLAITKGLVEACDKVLALKDADS